MWGDGRGRDAAGLALGVLGAHVSGVQGGAGYPGEPGAPEEGMMCHSPAGGAQGAGTATGQSRAADGGWPGTSTKGQPLQGGLRGPRAAFVTVKAECSVGTAGCTAPLGWGCWGDPLRGREETPASTSQPPFSLSSLYPPSRPGALAPLSPPLCDPVLGQQTPGLRGD